MFTAVACSRCGKAFQVAATALGTSVACPWCKESVLALPVASSPGESVTNAPLSLDAATQLPLPPAGPSPFPRLYLFGAISVFAGVLAFFAVRYATSGGSWSEFAAPDGSVRAKLPGDPTEETLSANPHSPATLGGKRYTANQWLTDVTAWMGWVDIDPERAKLARPEDLIAAERNRRIDELGGKVAADGPLKLDEFSGIKVRYDTPNGPAIDQFLVVSSGAHPRLYVLGASASTEAAVEEAANRVLLSFRISPKP